jgi:hypothetical protein
MTAKLYEIHVRGQVSDDVLDELGRLTVATANPRTVLWGPVRDQAALLGILLRLQNMGIELVEVRQFPDEGTAEDA